MTAPSVVAPASPIYQSPTNAASYTTISLGPIPPGKVAVLGTWNSVASNPPTQVSAVTGMGLTWESIYTNTYNTGTAQNTRLTFIAALNGASEASGALSVAFGGVTQQELLCVLGYIDGDVLIGASAADSFGWKNSAAASSHTGGTPLTITMPALTSPDSRVVALFGAPVNSTAQWTPGTDMYSVGAISSNSPNSVVHMMATSTDTVTIAPTHATTGTVGGIAMEILAAAADVPWQGTRGIGAASNTASHFPFHQFARRGSYGRHSLLRANA